MHTTNPNAFVTETNAWATALTEPEADVLFETIRRGALRALDVSRPAGSDGWDQADFHALRDIAREAAAVQSNLSTAFGWFTA